jgi:hypothetical protein
VTEFDRCALWIEAALEHTGGFFNLDDVRERVISGEAIFWPGERSAVVTEWGDFPRGQRVLNFWLAGGDLGELRRMHDAISAWARSQGATHTTIAGRAGWSKALGYRTAWTAMVRELA